MYTINKSFRVPLLGARIYIIYIHNHLITSILHFYLQNPSSLNKINRSLHECIFVKSKILEISWDFMSEIQEKKQTKTTRYNNLTPPKQTRKASKW